MKFGISQLNTPTPLWAKWMFRITMLVTSSVAMWVGGTNLIPEPVKLEVLLLLKCIDPFVFGLSKLFGDEPDALNNNPPS